MHAFIASVQFTALPCRARCCCLHGRQVPGTKRLQPGKHLPAIQRGSEADQVSAGQIAFTRQLRECRYSLRTYWPTLQQ